MTSRDYNMTSSRGPVTDAVSKDESRGISPARLAWYVGAWAALSAVLVLAVMFIDPPKRRPTAPTPGGQAVVTQSAGPQLQAGPSDQLATAAGSQDWRLDLAYTPVQAYHHGSDIQVTGCLRRPCGRKADLGSYPGDFVEAVRAQGNGKITNGEHKGAYLGWAAGIGYWLDGAPRDSRGDVLRAFSTAISGTSLLSLHTRLRVLSCGVDEAGRSNTAVCARLRGTTWTVMEVPNPGPTRSLTLYIGLENGPNFTGSAWATTFSRAALRIG